jgi:hypothetical protein
MAAYITYERERGLARRTVREFISEFRGLSGSTKQKVVLDAVAASRTSLAGFFGSDDHVNTDSVDKLLAAMQVHSRPVKPKDLGAIGEDHLRAKFNASGAALESFNYKKAEIIDNSLPYLIEFAFGYCPKGRRSRQFINGINWSVSVGTNPFQNLGDGGVSLDYILTEQRAGPNEPIVMVLHLACPRVEYLNRGKSSIVVPGKIAGAIKELVWSATKRWADQRRREDRHRWALLKRDDQLIHSKERKDTIKDVAWDVMPRAYRDASRDPNTGGTLPVAPRQIYYAARGEILKRTGKDNLDSDYFCQVLLVNYVRETGVAWDIVWDDRGHFTEPHTKYTFGLGTLNVRKYLAEIGPPSFFEPTLRPGGVATRGPDGRFGAVLFIEKEGFKPLFESVSLADRYDISVKSTKGMSVTAARHLADEMCGRYNIPLYVLHDFDVSGFSIFGTLGGNTNRYTFKNAIKVVDLGLRLTDVEELNLQSESVSLGKTDHGKIRRRLQRNGATDAEIEFLLGGKRVELNAMTSSQLVAFVERKLTEQGIRKIIPDKETLDKAYRLAVRSERLRKTVEDAIKASAKDDIAVPDDLAQKIQERFGKSPVLSWSVVVATMAKKEAATADDQEHDVS